MARRMSSDDRRAALIQAAIQVIARGGVAAATTRAIVAEAKMPLGAFHYVFSSREELLSQVIRTVTDGERMAVELALPYMPGADIEQVIVAALDAYLDLLVADPNRELALFELAFYGMRHDPALVDRQYGFYHREAESMVEYVAERCGRRVDRIDHGDRASPRRGDGRPHHHLARRPRHRRGAGHHPQCGGVARRLDRAPGRRVIRKSWVAALLLATVGVAAGWFGPIQILLPAQATQLGDEIGKENLLALVTGIGAAAAIIANPLWGLLSDRLSVDRPRRRPVLVAGVDHGDDRARRAQLGARSRLDDRRLGARAGRPQRAVRGPARDDRRPGSG